MSNIHLAIIQGAVRGVAVTGIDLSQTALDEALGEFSGTGVLSAGALALVAVQVGGLIDVCAAPSQYLVPAPAPAERTLVARWPVDRVVTPGTSFMPTGDAYEGPAVGLMSTDDALSGMNPDEAGIDAREQERRLYVLALRRSLRTLPQWATPAATVDRGAQGWPLVIAVGARVLIALGVVGIVAHHLDHVVELVLDRDVRTRQAELARAGADYETRLRAQRENPAQPMPPPTPLEVSVAGRVAQEGRAEWSDMMRQTAQTGMDIVVGLGVAYAVVTIFGGE